MSLVVTYADGEQDVVDSGATGGSGGGTVIAGVTSFNTRTGPVILTSSDVITALGYTPGTGSGSGGSGSGSINVYISPETPLASWNPSAGVKVAFNHNLGTRPVLYSAVLICTSAELGYSIGDEYDVTSKEVDATSVNCCYVNASEIGFVFHGDEPMGITSKTGGVTAHITYSKWSLVLKAVAVTSGSAAVTSPSMPTGGIAAWVTFNGQGAVGANATIHDSFGVASVSKVSTGVYTLTFSSNLPNTKYGVLGTATSQTQNTGTKVSIYCGATRGVPELKTTNQVRVHVSYTATDFDSDCITIAILSSSVGSAGGAGATGPVGPTGATGQTGPTGPAGSVSVAAAAIGTFVQCTVSGPDSATYGAVVSGSQLSLNLPGTWTCRDSQLMNTGLGSYPIQLWQRTA